MDQKQKPQVPALPFFESGNIYTGSICQSYRFRIAKEEIALTGSFWTQDVCYECAEKHIIPAYRQALAVLSFAECFS